MNDHQERDTNDVGFAMWWLGAFSYVMSTGRYSYVSVGDGYGWDYATLERAVRDSLYRDALGR